MENKTAEEKKTVNCVMEDAKGAIKVFEKLKKDITRDWKNEANHIISHVVFSPLLSFSVGKGCYTED